MRAQLLGAPALAQGPLVPLHAAWRAADHGPLNNPQQRRHAPAQGSVQAELALLPQPRAAACVFTDMRFTARLNQQLQLYSDLDNAFGTKPPVMPSGVAGSVKGAETDSGTYDAFGRRYYQGVSASFWPERCRRCTGPASTTPRRV